MSERPKPTRRTVLKILGTGVVSGTALVGTATANPRQNFGYVNDGVQTPQTFTLTGREGREKINCGPANVKTEQFSTDSDSVMSFYGIPSGWEVGDVLEISGLVTGCDGGEDAGMKEVNATLVE